MAPLFSSTTGAADYLVIKNNPKHIQIKSFCEALWGSIEPYTDNDFPDRFADNPHGRFWEIYLGTQLLNMGCGLQKKSSVQGPDFHFQHNGLDVWVEAIAPNEGEGKDRVPTLNEHHRAGPPHALPEEKIILRFTHAIQEKFQKYEGYIQDGIVNPTDIKIVGISGGNIELHHLDFDDELPLVCKAVYEVGPYVVRIDPTTMQISDQGFVERKEIIKESKSPVSSGFFEDKESSPITGIMYSSVGLYDNPGSSGDEFRFIHNKNASIPIPKHWMGKGIDYWKDNDILKYQHNQFQ